MYCKPHALSNEHKDKGPRSEKLLELMARKATGSRAMAGELQRIFDEQGGLCPYSGETLVIGINASVDHRVPRVTAPERASDPSNLQWVATWVNVMKNKTSHERFISSARSRAEEYDKLASKYLSKAEQWRTVADHSG